jgi:predicted MPP superfamily phosphohydrolase
VTPRQLQYKEAVKEHGGIVAAARALGIDHSVVSRVLNKRTERPEDGAGKRILVLPDVQAKPGIDFSYLRRIGTYALEKRPDIIVCGGDFADFPSLSSYDKGKRAFEGRRYKRDVEAAQFAMQAFLGPIEEHNKSGRKAYRPRMVLVLGNHENRVNRATNDDPMLEGMLSLKDLAYEEYGWEVHDFLEVVIIEGVAFSHYFTSGVMGRPVTTAQALLNKKHMSCVAFHQQGLQIATSHRADGALLTAVICGSAYEHDEDYLGPQGNKHWRGVLMLHAVKDGSYDLMPVSLDYLNRKYPNERYQTPAYSMPTAEEIAAGKM